MSRLADLEDAIHALKRDNLILSKAVKFYADPRAWSRMGEGAYGDVGTRARVALGDVERLARHATAWRGEG